MTSNEPAEHAGAKDAPPAAPTPPVPVAAFALLGLAAFASGLSLRVTDPLLPRLAAEFGVSLGDASYVVTAFSVAYGLSQLFFGPLGDRYGKYCVVGWACGASALTALLCALAGSFQALLVARLAAGATAAAVIPLSMAWIGDVVPYARRQPVIARFLIGQITGLSAGVLIGGVAADHVGRRLPFAAVALFFLAIGAALWSLDRRLPIEARATLRGDGPALHRTAAEFGAVLKVRWVRSVLLTVFMEGALLYGAFAFIASHLHHAFGLSLASAGSIVMLFGQGGVLFALASQTLVRQLGEAGMAAWGGGVMSASLAVIALAPAWWWSLPGCLCTGLGFYMLHNTLQTNATQMAPERRGAAVAAFASAFFLGQSAGVAAGAAVVGLVGTRGVIGIGAAGVLLVALHFARLRSAARVAV